MDSKEAPGDDPNKSQLSQDLNMNQKISEIASEFDTLLKDAKNFNLHINVLKKLLNLKERQAGYDLYMVRTTDSSGRTAFDTKANGSKATEAILNDLQEKLKQLKREVSESHLLGFCLAFNVQRLQKRLTGCPVDMNSTEKVVENLWKKYNKSKTNEAIIRYEFEEKRKLLRRLKHQLEQTRLEWKNFKTRKPEYETREEKQAWAETMRETYARKRKQPSEESGFAEGACGGEGAAGDGNDSAVHSESDGDPDDLLVAFDERKSKLDSLEEECYALVNNLSRKHETSSEASASGDEDSTARYHSPLLGDEDEVEVQEEDEDDFTGSLSDDYDEAPAVAGAIAFDINAGLGFDDTEEADVSEISWDTTLDHSEALVVPPEEHAVETTFDNISRRASGLLVLDSDDGEDTEPSGQRDVETFAETGEPIILCRLRRKAVEILISRLKEEKKFHETRESELKYQLVKTEESNSLLQTQIGHLKSGFWGRRQTGFILIGFVLLVANILTTINLFL